MTETGLAAEIRRAVPGLRGRLTSDQSLADLMWFRVGGPAEVLFQPADEDDLATVLAAIDGAVGVTVIGLGSNLLVRDGGIRGLVVRLGRGFNEASIEPDCRIRVGAAMPDARLARLAAEAGIDGLAFYRGIPGSIGGALRMNAGAHGGETREILVEVKAVDRRGRRHTLTSREMGYSYRHSDAPEDLIFTEALYGGRPGEPSAILAAMEEVAEYREAHQPVKARTGGSTFKNPPGNSAWKLVDQAGCRGFRLGDAMVSEKHCNFLINEGSATAEDIERLGETVRARVLASSGIALDWEIVRLGEPLPGHATGEALVVDRALA
ncbi:MAG: UDP-N-acetylmuramate dehydrogenase [Hyphomicrobiaceae bacterium]